ncbi:hypothetical protein MAP00_004509 [Monascus purpureus]|nr:hypothetical protein MAP00_004509 [Monascus purpureus]
MGITQAHHEKFIVIDHTLAFIGGLDLCWGRWDTNQHSLADVYRNPLLEMFPGQDYNNNRIMDFQSVQQWETNALNKSEYARMPWHDVAMGLIGDCVYDIAEHFILRWNMVKRDKYKRDQNVDWIILEGRTGRDEDLISVQHPKYPCGDYILHPFSPLKLRPRGVQGTVRAQVVRSSGDWSSGILVEHSIQNAYAEIIRNAEHFVYIENQFFITTTEHGQTPIYNTVGQAIVDACVRAGKEGRKFRVIIVIPAIPGFPGDLRSSGATGTRAIMDYQFKSINRGEHSVMGRIAAQGVDPNQHIFVFNMRSYDRINYPPKQLERDQRAGMDSISIQLELADALMGEGAFPDDDNKGHRHHGKRKSRRAMEKYQRKFEYIRESTSRLEEDKADRRIRGKDSVAEIAMANGGKMSDEQWEGDPEREKKHFVQEQLYIHGKLCIVDDRVVICGSVNINDRSQLGDRDSELAIVMEDQDLIDSTMDGKPYKAARQAATLRQHLWKEHLGLLPAQKPEAQDDPNAQPPDVCMNQVIEGPENELVQDPLGDKLWKTWTETATLNTEIYRYLFHADPDDCIRTFEDYDHFRPPGRYKEGHLFDSKLPAAEVRRKLDQIRGHVVWMPLEFLRDAEMAEPGLTVNRITESIYT